MVFRHAADVAGEELKVHGVLFGLGFQFYEICSRCDVEYRTATILSCIGEQLQKHFHPFVELFFEAWVFFHVKEEHPPFFLSLILCQKHHDFHISCETNIEPQTESPPKQFLMPVSQHLFDQRLDIHEDIQQIALFLLELFVGQDQSVQHRWSIQFLGADVKHIEPYLLEEGLNLVFSQFCFVALPFFVQGVVHDIIEMNDNVFLNQDDRQQRQIVGSKLILILIVIFIQTENFIILLLVVSFDIIYLLDLFSLFQLRNNALHLFRLFFLLITMHNHVDIDIVHVVDDVDIESPFLFFFFLLLIASHDHIGMEIVEVVEVVDIVGVEWLVLLLQVGNRALLHLERHQLVKFRQIDIARLTYIEIACDVSVGVRTQQVRSSPTEIANQTRRVIVGSLLQLMLIEASQSRAGRLPATGAVQHVAVLLAALGADRPAKPLL